MKKYFKIFALVVLITCLVKTVLISKSIKKRLSGRFITDSQMSGLTRIYRSNNNLSNRHQGLTVDWWFDTCFARTTWQRTWHPLFPWQPQKTTTTLISGEQERNLGNLLRRIHGFMFPDNSAFYEFKLSSRDGAEVILLDTRIQLENIDTLSLPLLEISTEVLRMNLTKREMDFQDRKLNLSQLFSNDPQKIWLKAHRLYFLEIVQGGKNFAHYKLHWRDAGKSDSIFKMIGQDNLLRSNITRNFSRASTSIERYPITEEERMRNSFNSIQLINVEIPSEYHCKFSTDLEPIKVENLYDGWYYLRESSIFPNESLKGSYQLLEREEALNVSLKYFERISDIYQK